MALAALSLWMLVVWAALAAPQSGIDWAVGGAALTLALLLAWRMRLLNAATFGFGAWARALRRFLTLAPLAPRAVKALAARGEHAGVLRVLRARDADPNALAAALSLTPGVQTLSAESKGLLVHVLDERAPPIDTIRDIDAALDRRAP